METKKTAVDWLIQELGEYFPHEIGGIHLMVEQAKQINKEQIMDAYSEGFDAGYLLANGEDTKFDGREQYYNETYGKQTK